MVGRHKWKHDDNHDRFYVMPTSRCGRCLNCLELERVKKRVLACANPPFSHADDGVIELWNKELGRLPCTGGRV